MMAPPANVFGLVFGTARVAVLILMVAGFVMVACGGYLLAAKQRLAPIVLGCGLYLVAICATFLGELP